MSLFDTIMGEAHPVVMETLGQSLTYNDPESDPVTLTGIVGPIVAREEDENGRTRKLSRTVTISTAAIGGVTDPDSSATVTIAGVVWSVEGIERQTGTVVKLTLVRPEPIERSRPGYRAGR